MRRADRLFQIVQLLRGGRLTTAARLAERLEVSERTIYRDIADLQASGVPVDGAAGVGYVLRDGFDLPPLMFTRDEIVALVAGARMIRAWGGASMARGAEEALVKIAAVLPEAERARAAQVQVRAFAPGMTDDLKARLDDLEAAVDARTRSSAASSESQARWMIDPDPWAAGSPWNRWPPTPLAVAVGKRKVRWSPITSSTSSAPVTRA